MKTRKSFLLFLVCTLVILTWGTSFAAPGKFYVVGMGTVPDLLTLRGLEAIREAQIILLEDLKDREAWKSYIGQKEVWIAPNSARLFFGLDPEEVSDPELREAVAATDKARQEIIDKIRSAVEAGKTVAALQWGDPMMFGMTYYFEMLPENLPSEIVPGVGAFQAASAAVKMSPPYGWDTNAVILSAADWPGRTDTNEKLIAHQTSMVFYTMFIDYPALFEQLNRHYPQDTPAAVVCHAGDREKQKIIHSTVGKFLEEVKYGELPVHTLLVGKFLKVGQARKDGIVSGRKLLEGLPAEDKDQQK
jgi:precorrin-4 methylase